MAASPGAAPASRCWAPSNVDQLLVSECQFNTGRARAGRAEPHHRQRARQLLPVLRHRCKADRRLPRRVDRQRREHRHADRAARQRGKQPRFRAVERKRRRRRWQPDRGQPVHQQPPPPGGSTPPAVCRLSTTATTCTWKATSPFKGYDQRHHGVSEQHRLWQLRAGRGQQLHAGSGVNKAVISVANLNLLFTPQTGGNVILGGPLGLSGTGTAGNTFAITERTVSYSSTRPGSFCPGGPGRRTLWDQVRPARRARGRSRRRCNTIRWSTSSCSTTRRVRDRFAGRLRQSALPRHRHSVVTP